MRWASGLQLALLAVLAVSAGASVAADWRTASREPAGIAPDPAVTREAVVQVYTARAFAWRGYFGVHSWVAVKPTAAPQFTVYEVIGWRAFRGVSVLSVSNRPADGRWFGAMPEIIAEVRSEGVDGIIERIAAVARTYPHVNEYRLWPGPNSNTFTAHIGRAVPELRLDLPPTAIGKDYLPGGDMVAASPSGTGFQVSLWGLAGILIGAEEGLEINFLGMTFGLDPLDLAVKLPVFGRLAALPR